MNLRTCFKRELDAQKNATSGEGSRKCRKYLYFDQLLFLLLYLTLKTAETQSNLSTRRNEDEEEANKSQEDEKELPRKFGKKS